MAVQKVAGRSVELENRGNAAVPFGFIYDGAGRRTGFTSHPLQFFAARGWEPVHGLVVDWARTYLLATYAGIDTAPAQHTAQPLTLAEQAEYAAYLAGDAPDPRD